MWFRPSQVPEKATRWAVEPLPFAGGTHPPSKKMVHSAPHVNPRNAVFSHPVHLFQRSNAITQFRSNENYTQKDDRTLAS